jgi:hypothetical protein
MYSLHSFIIALSSRYLLTAAGSLSGRTEEQPREAAERMTLKLRLRGDEVEALLSQQPKLQSFETAMKRLGGSVINLGPEEGSSISKGESLADKVRVVAGYSDAL